VKTLENVLDPQMNLLSILSPGGQGLEAGPLALVVPGGGSHPPPDRTYY
jgi:hypothetical protein